MWQDEGFKGYQYLENYTESLVSGAGLAKYTKMVLALAIAANFRRKGDTQTIIFDDNCSFTWVIY